MINKTILLLISLFTHISFTVSVPNNQIVVWLPYPKESYMFPVINTEIPSTDAPIDLQKTALLITDIIANVPSIVFGIGGLYQGLTPQGALEANLQFLVFGASLLVCSVNNIVKSLRKYSIIGSLLLSAYHEKYLRKDVAITTLSVLTSALLWKGFGIIQIDLPAVIFLLSLSTFSAVKHIFEAYKSRKMLKNLSKKVF